MLTSATRAACPWLGATAAPTGPFTPVFRHQLTQEWVDKLRRLGVPHSPTVSLIKTLQASRQPGGLAALGLMASTVLHTWQGLPPLDRSAAHQCW